MLDDFTLFVDKGPVLIFHVHAPMQHSWEKVVKWINTINEKDRNAEWMNL